MICSPPTRLQVHEQFILCVQVRVMNVGCYSADWPRVNTGPLTFYSEVKGYSPDPHVRNTGSTTCCSRRSTKAKRCVMCGCAMPPQGVSGCLSPKENTKVTAKFLIYSPAPTACVGPTRFSYCRGSVIRGWLRFKRAEFVCHGLNPLSRVTLLHRDRTLYSGVTPL